MPFQSEKQRRYLHANHPEIAKRWEKEYAHGGILDITGDEEITTEEGNDISLVDESETGVSTLFRAKDGGTPQLAKKSKDGNRPGYRGDDAYGGGTSGGSNQGGDDKSYQSNPRERGIQQAYEVTGPAVAKERQRQDELDTLVATGPGSPIEKYENPLDEFLNVDMKDDAAIKAATPAQKQGYRKRRNYIDSQKRNEFETKHAEVNNYLAKKGKKRLMQAVVMMAFGLPPPAIFTKQDLLDKDLIKGVFSLTKANNAYKKSLEETIEGYNKLGMTQYHHAVDTPLQTKEQEYLDFTQKYDTDETDSGPRAIEVLPVGDESSPVEEMEVEYDWLGAIRDKQQKKKEYDEKIARENPIGTDMDVIAIGNKGGLANLFRVKKQ